MRPLILLSTPCAALVLLTGHPNSTLPVPRPTGAAPSITALPAIPSGQVHCDVAYCANGTSYCLFWAGVRSWDYDGPQPGEVLTTLGRCRVGRTVRTAL